MKKIKKYITSAGSTALTGAGMSMGLSAIGGASSVHGNAGISNATKYIGAMGTVTGAGALIGMVDRLGKKKIKKRRR